MAIGHVSRCGASSLDDNAFIDSEGHSRLPACLRMAVPCWPHVIRDLQLLLKSTNTRVPYRRPDPFRRSLASLVLRAFRLIPAPTICWLTNFHERYAGTLEGCSIPVRARLVRECTTSPPVTQRTARRHECRRGTPGGVRYHALISGNDASFSAGCGSYLRGVLYRANTLGDGYCCRAWR
jgi:hypothetical protein